MRSPRRTFRVTLRYDAINRLDLVVALFVRRDLAFSAAQLPAGRAGGRVVVALDRPDAPRAVFARRTRPSRQVRPRVDDQGLRLRRMPDVNGNVVRPGRRVQRYDECRFRDPGWQRRRRVVRGGVVAAGRRQLRLRRPLFAATKRRK